jgi:hypothetical protein
MPNTFDAGIATLLSGAFVFPIIANFPGREFLPGCHDLGRCIAVHRLEKHMHMIGHHDPCEQAIR